MFKKLFNNKKIIDFKPVKVVFKKSLKVNIICMTLNTIYPKSIIKKITHFINYKNKLTLFNKQNHKVLTSEYRCKMLHTLLILFLLIGENTLQFLFYSHHKLLVLRIFVTPPLHG